MKAHAQASPASGVDLRRLAIVAGNVALFWLAIPGAIFWLGRRTDSALGLLPVAPWARAAGGVAAVAGAWLCASSIATLIRRGRGMPISALPPTRLVVSGPYRYWTHPLYTGFAVLMAGVGAALGSLGAGLVVPLLGLVWVSTWIARYEEPGLERRFGVGWRAHAWSTGLLLPFPARRIPRRLVLWLYRCLFRVRFEGMEHAPHTGPVVCVGDHLSYLDVFLAQVAARTTTTVPVTAEAFRRPVLRQVLRVLGGVPHRRYQRGSETGRFLQALVEQDRAVGLAVEGERSWTGELGPLAPGVAAWLAQLDVPILPVAYVGSYRQWPRWAPRPDRSVAVTVRVGAPFRLRDLLAEPTPAAVEALVRERLAALRDPDEHRVDPSPFPGARPELVLWRCPSCGREECLRMTDRTTLSCSECGAAFTAAGGVLTDASGRSDTLAGWARRAAALPSLPSAPSEPRARAVAELRCASVDAPVAAPLRSSGPGEAILEAGRITWSGAGGTRVLPLADVRTVTTERADTLQLATRDEVVQLVFARASPLRWQTLVRNQLEQEASPWPHRSPTSAITSSPCTRTTTS